MNRRHLFNVSLFPADASVEACGDYLKSNSALFTTAARAAGLSIE